MAISGELPLPVESENGATPVRRVDSGQVNTLVDLYRRHQQRIYRYCLALLRNPDDAEDATQETFTRAAPFLPNLPGDLSAYLTTVARNICCDVVRARARRSVPIDNVPLADRKVSPERQSVDWDVVRRMWRQLSPAERQLFAYTFAGYKYEEIASRTGMSRPSVSVGLARARRRLRDLAAATGTLALLPLGIRRLLNRLARRANAALSSAQATVLSVADQVGVAVASAIAGLFVISAAAPAQPALVPTAVRHGVHGRDAGVIPAAIASAPAVAARLATTASPSHGAATPHTSSSIPQLPAGASSLVPGSNASPFDTGIRDMAASPNYPTDHTVLISGGVLKDGCIGMPGAPCQAMFKSTDAGASWTRLTDPTFQGGTIVLPPAYPTDPAIFVVTGGVGLEESPQGDGNFSLVIPGVEVATIAPWSPAGRDELATLSAANTVEIYSAGPSVAPTSTAVLPANFQGQALTFASPGTVAVAGLTTSPASSGGQVGAVTLCPLSGVCGPPVILPGSGGYQPAIATTLNVAADHLVVVKVDYEAYVSRDGGGSFAAALPAPTGRGLLTMSVGAGPAGPRILVSTMAALSPATLLMSDDLGRTFTDITGNLDVGTVLAGTASYANGTILAALTADTTNHFALRQSTGNGTWIKPA